MIKVVEEFNMELVMDVAMEGVVNKEVTGNYKLEKGILHVNYVLKRFLVERT